MYGADPGLFGQLPPDLAVQVLTPFDPRWLAEGYAPDSYQGAPGTYLGLSPGLGSAMAKVRLLYAGGVMVPFVMLGGRWVPLAYFDRRKDVFIYNLFSVDRRGSRIYAGSDDPAT